LKLFVVLPSHNEEKNIEPLVAAIGEALPGFSYEIIAVNDGSTDETSNIYKRLQSHQPIVLLEHETNKGLSATLQTGLSEAIRRAADDDYIITMDADQTQEPKYIRDMMESREGYDIIIASRYVEGGEQLNVPYYRKILSGGINYLIKNIAKLPVRDATSGYRGYRAGKLRELYEISCHNLIGSKGFEASAELLLKTYLLNSSIKEIPFVLDYGLKKGKSKMKLFSTIINYIMLLRKITDWKRKMDLLNEKLKRGLDE